ncbi:SpoIVB peptidase S55 domain-containing protein [Nocardioides sp. YIM 152588]|uniref:SpoIVB peptidase S55 domain-containing protein n=1 Tax=Nocardioides sp. YIM 152588 TaxID=3158259 RepID=UPI0032E4D627
MSSRSALLPAPSRPRRLAALGTSLCVGATLAAVATGATTASVHAAAPPGDCAEAFPIADLAADDPVHGLTVSRGTTPEEFTGTVLGILEDGIAPGRDMIMMDLDSTAIQDAGGIWQGMSGSPVYSEDGRLIGAVAYGLSWGSSPIAGVTPFEYMEGYLGPAAAPGLIDVPRAAAKKIAATGEVTRTQAAQGFRRLPVPMSVSGVSADRLEDGLKRKTKKRGYLKKNAYAAPAGGTTAAGEETVVAGGNLAAVESAGDVTAGGVGTVTSVCGDRIVGFGHPMYFAGPVSYGLGAADAIYVQPESLGAPFKVANFGDIVGVIDQDRLTGIAGAFGPAPASTAFTSDLTYGGAAREGSTDIFVPDSLAWIAFYGALANHDVLLDRIGPGSETQSWQIEGIDADGTPFSISYGDRWTSPWDIAVDASYPLADVLWALTELAGVSVTSVTSTGEATDEEATYSVKKIEQRRGGVWVNLAKRQAVVKAGKTLRLRATLMAADGTTATAPLSQKIPKRFAGTRTWGSVRGGGWGYIDVWNAKSVADVVEALAEDPPNDAVSLDGRLRKRGTRLDFSAESAPQDLVIFGSKSFTLRVK